MAQIGLPVTRDGCGHHVMAHGIFTLIEEPMDPPLFSSSKMSASRARSACRLVLPSTVWNVLTTSPATESVCERIASHRSLFLRLFRPRLV